MQEAYITAPPASMGIAIARVLEAALASTAQALVKSLGTTLASALAAGVASLAAGVTASAAGLFCRPLLVLCVTGVCFAAIRCRCHPCRCCFGCWGWLRWFYNLSLSLLDSLLLKLSSLGLAFLAAGPSVVSFWTGGAFLFMVSGHTFLFPKLLGRLGRQDGLRCS